MTGNGADYRGVQTRSRSGYLCQQWDATTPHDNSALVSSTIYPNAGLANNNYCRNPVNASSSNQASTIWCYTTDTSIEWELCTPIGVIQAACPGGYKVPDETNRDILKYSSYVIWGLSGVWLLLVALLYRRIQLAIGLNEVAAQFLAHTPSILVIPRPSPCWALFGFFAGDCRPHSCCLRCQTITLPQKPTKAMRLLTEQIPWQASAPTAGQRPSCTSLCHWAAINRVPRSSAGDAHRHATFLTGGGQSPSFASCGTTIS